MKVNYQCGLPLKLNPYAQSTYSWVGGNGTCALKVCVVSAGFGDKYVWVVNVAV